MEKTTATSTAQKPQMENHPPQEDTSKPQKQLPKDTRTSEKTEATTKSEPSKEESSFFGFGFGGARSRSPSPQPAVPEKVLGFGSSFFSSASSLISSVVQDESSKTPPTPRKGSAVSQTSVKSTTPPLSRKGSSVSQTSLKTTAVLSTGTLQQSTALKDSTNVLQAPESKPLSHKQMQGKQSVPTQPFKPPSADTKVDTSPSQPRATAKSPKSVPKECLLCKVELKKDPPNFNTCTECKAIVCNLCGFNPTPHKTEVR